MQNDKIIYIKDHYAPTEIKLLNKTYRLKLHEDIKNNTDSLKKRAELLKQSTNKVVTIEVKSFSRSKHVEEILKGTHTIDKLDTIVDLTILGSKLLGYIAASVKLGFSKTIEDLEKLQRDVKVNHRRHIVVKTNNERIPIGLTLGRILKELTEYAINTGDRFSKNDLKEVMAHIIVNIDKYSNNDFYLRSELNFEYIKEIIKDELNMFNDYNISHLLKNRIIRSILALLPPRTLEGYTDIIIDKYASVSLKEQQGLTIEEAKEKLKGIISDIYEVLIDSSFKKIFYDFVKKKGISNYLNYIIESIDHTFKTSDIVILPFEIDSKDSDTVLEALYFIESKTNNYFIFVEDVPRLYIIHESEI